MQIDAVVRKSIFRDISLSFFIYALPVALMYFTFSLKDYRPWQNPLSANPIGFLHGWSNYGISCFVLLLGVIEFLSGLYDRDRWNGNEKTDRLRLLRISLAGAQAVRNLFRTESPSANSAGTEEHFLMGAFLVGIFHHLRRR
jgi:hypothetical protein